MNDDGTRGDLTRIGNLSDQRRTEVVEEYDDHDHAITVAELLETLDGNGLTITSKEEINKQLEYFNMKPNTNITWAGTDA
jgi:hypothetical protein